MHVKYLIINQNGNNYHVTDLIRYRIKVLNIWITWCTTEIRES